MNPRIARGIAWVLVGIYFVLIGTGIFFQVLTNTTPGDIAIPIILFAIAVIVVGIWPVIGALIIAHHPRHPVAWLLFATFPVVAIDMFTIGYASYATFKDPGSLQLPGAMLVWLNWSGLPFVVFTFTLMTLLFPTGRFLSPRWRSVAWTGAGALLILLVMEALEPGPLVLFPSLDNPYGVPESVWSVLAPIYFAVIFILVLSSLASVISLLVRLRSAQGDERQQIKWLVIPAIIYWIGIPIGLVDEYDPSGIALRIGAGLHLLSVPAIVITVALAIFKYRLYDMKIIINRALVYGALTASVIGLYILIVGGAGLVVQTDLNLAALLITLFLVGVVYHPMRTFYQGGVDRLMYGKLGVVPNSSFHHPTESEHLNQNVRASSAVTPLAQSPAHWLGFA
ncbi:MAG TPA: hypothetical protein VI524_15255, partial [Anaerolineales bacterium]|nr:hypothetical protein [Anaerolineales bacterium]